MSKDGTLHLVYQRQYYDDEDMDYFFINYTIFRNVPLSQLNRLNNKEFKQKVKEFCDKNFKETATNYNDVFRGQYDNWLMSIIKLMVMSMVMMVIGENDFFEDYGQKYDTRQFFKHDFNKEITKFMGGIK